TGSLAAAREAFEAAHRQQFGFIYENKPLIVEAVTLEGTDRRQPAEQEREAVTEPCEPEPAERTRIFMGGSWREAQVHLRRDLRPGYRIKGPALIVEEHQTIVVEPGWHAAITAHGHVLLQRKEAQARSRAIGTDADP